MSKQVILRNQIKKGSVIVPTKLCLQHKRVAQAHIQKLLFFKHLLLGCKIVDTAGVFRINIILREEHHPPLPPAPSPLNIGKIKASFRLYTLKNKQCTNIVNFPICAMGPKDLYFFLTIKFKIGWTHQDPKLGGSPT